MTLLQKQRSSVFFDYDNDIVIDILEDARLQTFIPLVYRLHEIDGELDSLKTRLMTYGIGSPRIKNSYEAFYLTSEHEAGDSNTTQMIMRKLSLEDEQRRVIEELNAIAETIRNTLTDEEIDLLTQYYEAHKSYQLIGDERYMSKDTVRRKFIKMRKDLFKYEHE